MGKEGFASMHEAASIRPIEVLQRQASPPLGAGGPPLGAGVVQEPRKTERIPEVGIPQGQDRNPRGGRRKKGGESEGILPAGTIHVNTNGGGHAGGSQTSPNGGKGGKRGRKGDDRKNQESKATIVDTLRIQLGKTADKLELGDIVGHVSEFSLDQHGSRFIQGKLDYASPADKQILFVEIVPVALTLCTDVFGNYVVQKMIEHGNEQQCATLAACLKGRVVELSRHMYGCRVVQKALEMSKPAMQIELVSELRPPGIVQDCIKDQNGNHVVQKAIEKVDNAVVQFIVDAFHGQAPALAMHPYGCRVMQRILEFCSKQQARPILDEVLQKILPLSDDQYGNYVVQHILERGAADDREAVWDVMRGQVLTMSMHKFASNVVEKVLQHGTQAQRDALHAEILLTPEGGEETPIVKMMQDQFGNYVVQKMLEYSSGQQRDKLVNCIRASSTELKKVTYGKHLLSRLEKVTGINLE